MAFPMLQTLKNPYEIAGDQVRSLCWDDTLQKRMTTPSDILALRIPWTGVWWATVHGVAKKWTQLSN